MSNTMNETLSETRESELDTAVMRCTAFPGWAEFEGAIVNDGYVPTIRDTDYDLPWEREAKCELRATLSTFGYKFRQ